MKTKIIWKICGKGDKTCTRPVWVKEHSRKEHYYLRKTCEKCDNTFIKPAWVKKHSGNEHTYEDDKQEATPEDEL